MLAIHIIGKEQGFHLLGLVIMIEKFAETTGQKRNQLRDFSLGNSVEALANTENIGPPAQRGGVNLRRWLQEEGLQISCQLFQLIIDLHKPLGVLCGNLAE